MCCLRAAVEVLELELGREEVVVAEMEVFDVEEEVVVVVVLEVEEDVLDRDGAPVSAAAAVVES